ncbi:MAG: o-succinylbenzoate--CoA ligase [Chloroflexia bacterium]|nr:o-succinylbenzoate--CoA ligase [Chloroflexia bacterium]
MSTENAVALPHWLDIAAHTHPDKRALDFGAKRWSFSELRYASGAAVGVLARALTDRPGRIGILSTNRPGFVFAVHAATYLDVPFVPLNWRQTSDEIAWQIRDADIGVLVADEAGAELAAGATADGSVAMISMREIEGGTSPVKRPPAGRRIDLGREAAVIYTSGTSGRPRGARITYGNLWFSAVASALHLGAHADDVWLAALPLFHIGGLSILFRGAIGATTTVLHEQFEPATALAAIDDGATIVSVVPTMLGRMLELRRDTLWPENLRCVLVGGSAAPTELIEECLRRRIPVAPTYGLTESSSQVATLLPADAHRKPRSSGVPLPLTEVRITDANGVVASGAFGEIEFRGPTLFAGYLGDGYGPAGRTVDGWFQSGDIGYLDEDGFLFLVDRRDDLIVSGGENIYPAEIEQVLRGHPRVIDAAAIGVPDERWGSRPVAAVIWHGDSGTASEALRRHCAERLASYKIPDRFVLVADLPRSASGKLRRRALREKFFIDEPDLIDPNPSGPSRPEDPLPQQ